MQRFYNDDNKNPLYDPDDDEDEDDESEFDHDIFSFMDQSDIIDTMNLDAVYFSLLLEKSIEIAKDSWFWRFKSSDKKMEEIDKIYKKLTKFMEDNKKEEKETPDADV